MYAHLDIISVAGERNGFVVSGRRRDGDLIGSGAVTGSLEERAVW